MEDLIGFDSSTLVIFLTNSRWRMAAILKLGVIVTSNMKINITNMISVVINPTKDILYYPNHRFPGISYFATTP